MRLFKTYLTTHDLGLGSDPAVRRWLWQEIPKNQALMLLAMMLGEVDTNGQLDSAPRGVDGRWAAQMTNTELRK